MFVFGFLWFVTRVVGRSTLGELSTFQLLLYVTMGDLVQQAVTQQDSSVTSAVLAVGVFALLTVALSWLNTRSRRIRPITHGVPAVIVDDGEPVLSILRSERISIDDLMTAARNRASSASTTSASPFWRPTGTSLSSRTTASHRGHRSRHQSGSRGRIRRSPPRPWAPAGRFQPRPT
jgi:hypothetical protein